MAEEKQPAIELKRRAVTVNSSRKPVVFYAKETITWREGSVPISGIGKSRSEALIAVDVQFESLKKILNIH